MFMNDGFAFSTLLNILPQGAFRINLAQKSRFDFVNESLAAMLGYTIDEMLALDPQKIFSSKRVWESLMDRLLKESAIIKDHEIVLKTKDGEKFVCRVSFVGVRNSRGEIRMIEGMVENASSQYQLVRDLADSKELFKTVFNNSPVGIIVSDKDMQIIAWNPFAEQMLGRDRQDLFNLELKKLFSSKDWKQLKIDRVFRKGFLPDMEAEIIRKNGTRFDAGISLSVIRDIQGEILGAIGIMHDVSDQKRSHKMLLEAKKAAEEASKAKTMFLANMSHEVRTPMNTIMGMIDLTLDTQLTEEQLDNLKTVKNAADILLSLLNDILDLSRVEAGKIQIEYIEISIEKIVESVCKTMNVLAKNKNIGFKWSVDPKVPPLVKGDPVRVRQILVNLVNNAIKFTLQGGIEVHVRSLSEKNGHCELEFSVKDDGV
ncbi:MAG TPA: PAS domain S-box protein, partial [Candidatus Omnitrophota bacterium]|nr:PAS domain S-box protein [Candidatus Omnitrophota bacterium]